MTRRGGGAAVTSHRSAGLVSLAGDSLLQALSKYTCYSFPTRQRRLTRPDKAIYPPPAQPVQTLSLMFSLLQEINMFGSRQTTLLCQAGSSRLAGHHWGPWQQMYTTKSTSSASSESTLDTINSAGSTVLRINSTAHMRHTKDQHSSSIMCQVMSASRKQATEGILIQAQGGTEGESEGGRETFHWNVKLLD